MNFFEAELAPVGGTATRVKIQPFLLAGARYVEVGEKSTSSLDVVPMHVSERLLPLSPV